MNRMRPVKKKPVTVKEMEKNICRLLQEHDYSSVMADGSLSAHFVLAYLIRNNDHAARTYGKILHAYEHVKRQEGYVKIMQARRVTQKTLSSIVLFYECVVRPLKAHEEMLHGGLHVGEILKLHSPKGKEDYFEGEEWKASLYKEERYHVGDKVFYNMKSNIILDNEMLHLVSCFTGKILE